MSTMKAKITIRDAKWLHAYCIGYCDAQNLLRYETPIFYTCNQFGRRADFYKLENPRDWNTIRISTWYSPTGYKYIDYERLKNYEKKAQNIPEMITETREKKQRLRLLFFEMLEDHYETTEELINFSPLTDYVIKNETD